MAITVGDIYTQFPGFNPKDMIALMNGRTDFDGSDTVSLSNIASYNGGFVYFCCRKRRQKFYQSSAQK